MSSLQTDPARTHSLQTDATPFANSGAHQSWLQHRLLPLWQRELHLRFALKQAQRWLLHSPLQEHRGFYDDALRVKRNEAELCLHDPLGGGFSPPAVKALHKRAKKARVRDRTNYTCRRKTSFAAFHGQRVSLGVVKGEGETVEAAVAREKASQLLRDMTPQGA